MAWISWSRTWATRRTTTTSRKPLRCSSKILRWKRMYLLFASRSKAKAKPRRRTPACSSTRTVLIGEWTWTDIEPENYSSIAYPVSKQHSTLLRHGDLPREEDGAVEFWRWKDYFRNDFVHSQHWSDEMWKSTMARGGGNKKRFQYCTDPSGQEIISELFKVIHDAISLILNCRTTYWFRTVSSSTFITSDVQSIYTPSQIQDWSLEDRFWAKDRRCSSCQWILWTRNKRIRM